MKTPARLLVLASLFVCALTASAKDEDAGWVPLFNGTDLTGWKQEGNGIFKVEDGCLVGTQTDGKGGDLFTTAEYDNFDCRFTYKVKWPANSGVWFRNQYQFDILKYANPVAYSGTLYCPGKLFLTANKDESLENRDDWNEGRIEARGSHLTLWLNGHKVGECDDTTHAKGRFGLQVHGGGDLKGMEIRLKRFEMRPLPAPSATPAP